MNVLLRLPLKKVLCILLSVALAITFVPTLSLAALAGENETSTAGKTVDKVDMDIDQMLAKGNYVEGQAIAVVRADLAPADTENTTHSNAQSLLDSAEVLMSTSADVAQDALDVVLPNANKAASQDSSIVAVSTDAENAIETVKVSSDTLTMRELLEQLSTDPRVISVDPNYITASPSSENAESESQDTSASVDSVI